MSAKNMSKNKLHKYICELLDLLDDHNIDISGYQDRWNFITDINTNEIRKEGLEEAIILADEMESVYQTLSNR